MYSSEKIGKEFGIHDSLHSKIWKDDETLDPKVRKAILLSVKNFLKTLVPMRIIDVRLTGSLANFNYSNLSDLDIHIVTDYSEVMDDVELAAEYFSLKKYKWNREHNIKLYGHEIEVYVEDNNEKHIANGLYSIKNQKWINKPSREQPKFDPEDVATKSNHFRHLFHTVLKLYQNKKYKETIEMIDSIKSKIKKMRQTGLEKAGEFSTENLTFKVLRRTGMLKRLNEIKQKASDELLSVENKRF